jgi:hypothetical protein
MLVSIQALSAIAWKGSLRAADTSRLACVGNVPAFSRPRADREVLEQGWMLCRGEDVPLSEPGASWWIDSAGAACM